MQAVVNAAVSAVCWVYERMAVAEMMLVKRSLI